MKRVLSFLLAITLLLSFTGCDLLSGNSPTEAPTETPTETPTEVPTEAPTNPPAGTVGKETLGGKKVIFVGDSMMFWGQCVLRTGNDADRYNDQGYFYQLCKANGIDVTVTNWTFPAKGPEYIMNHYITDSGAADQLKDLNYDYVIFRGTRQTAATAEAEIATLTRYIEKFRAVNPDVKFIYYVTAGAHKVALNESFPVDVLDNIKNIEKLGVTIADWGKVVSDIVTGETPVPGATQDFNFNSFVVAKTIEDGAHPNVLAGYVAALTVYCSITGESAVGQPYSFCGDTSLNSKFDLAAYEAANYVYGTSNFRQIFDSPADMAGLQQLVDKCLNEKAFREYQFTPQPDHPHDTATQTHCYCSGHLYHSCAATTWTPIDSLDNMDWSKDGYYYFTNNITYAPTKTATVTGNISICFNGYDLVVGSGSVKLHPFTVTTGTLNLTDCASTQGTFKNEDEDTDTGVVNEIYSLLRIEGGTVNIFGGNYLWTLSGGNRLFSLYATSGKKSVLNFYNGTAKRTGSASGSGGILQAENNSEFNMYGGSFTAGKIFATGKNLNGYGAGITATKSTSVINLYGGIIKNGKANDTTDTANGGYGGNIYIAAGTLNISGNVTIQNGVAAVAGHDIYVKSGTVNLSGKPIIGELYLAAGKTIKVNGNLMDGASIGINAADPGIIGTVASGMSADASHFTSLVADMTIALNNGTLSFVPVT